MIGKVGLGKRFNGLINYLLDPKKKAVVFQAEGVRYDQKKYIIEDFKSQSSMRPGISSPVVHVSISFDNKDQVDVKKMREIVGRYKKEMGWDDTQILAVQHRDADHKHCHIVFNRIGNDGQPINYDHSARRTMSFMKKYEKEYGFTIAADQSHKEKTFILNTIRKASSLKEVEQMLLKRGWAIKYNQSKNTGTITGWSFVHKRKGIVWKASEVHRSLSYKKVIASFDKDPQVKMSIPIVSPTQNQLASTNLETPSNTVPYISKSTNPPGQDEEEDRIRKRKRKGKRRGRGDDPKFVL